MNATRRNISNLIGKQNEIFLSLRHFNDVISDQNATFDLFEVVEELGGKQNNQSLHLDGHTIQLRGLSERIDVNMKSLFQFIIN